MLNPWVSIWGNTLFHSAVSSFSGTWRWSVCAWTSSVWCKSSLLCWTWWKCHSLGFGKRSQNPVLLQHGNYCALYRYAKATILNFLLLVHSYVGRLEVWFMYRARSCVWWSQEKFLFSSVGQRVNLWVKCWKLFLWLYFIVFSFYMLDPHKIGVLVTLSEIVCERQGDKDPPLVLCFLPGEPRWNLVYFCITNS